MVEKYRTGVSPLNDDAELAKKEGGLKSIDDDAWLRPLKSARSAAVALCLDESCLRGVIWVVVHADKVGERSCLAEIVIGQLENCFTAAASRSGRASVCLVDSDSWLLAFAFGLAGR